MLKFPKQIVGQSSGGQCGYDRLYAKRQWDNDECLANCRLNVYEASRVASVKALEILGNFTVLQKPDQCLWLRRRFVFHLRTYGRSTCGSLSCLWLHIVGNYESVFYRSIDLAQSQSYFSYELHYHFYPITHMSLIFITKIYKSSLLTCAVYTFL